MPIAYKSYMSSAKMRVLKPEIDEINAKYPKQEDAMKKQQAIMDLYKKADASPMSGCLPMLLQFPIFMSVYQAVSRMYLTDGTVLNSPNWVNKLNTKLD